MEAHSIASIPSFSNLEFAPQKFNLKFAVDVKKVKRNKKQRRQFFKKWKKVNRKKLGFGAGVLSIFGLLAWRRKLKKIKKQKQARRRRRDSGDEGCIKVIVGIIVLGLFAVLGQWIIKTIFGITVGTLLGALCGILILGLVVGIIKLIRKSMNN